MTQPSVHLVKLCVGAEKVEDLAAWQATKIDASPDGCPRHVTRMWPKRGAEIVDCGGSLYWVFKGAVLARQRVMRLDEVVGDDGITRCGIVLEPDIHRTRPSHRKPFQGWRYLKPEDAPADLPPGREADDELPPELDAALTELGVL